jgi:integrase
LGLIRAIYNWANGTSRLEVNPTLRLKKRNVSKPRERVLRDPEVRALWQALDAAPVDSKPIRRHSATRAETRIASDNGVLDIGTHDLRRTLATGLGEMGVADVIERVLNHAPRTVAGKHYNHAKLFEGMRTALEAWSERVRWIVEGAEPVSNVRPLRITGSQA